MKDYSPKKRARIERQYFLLGKELGIPQTPHEAGEQWEKSFIQIAQRRGYDATRADCKKAPFDAIVCGFRVQCKKRLRRDLNGRVQLAYRTRETRGANRRAYYRGEFDVLALRCESKTYLIPESALLSGNGETLTNDFNPEAFASFINNWDVFRGVSTASNQIQLYLWKA